MVYLWKEFSKITVYHNGYQSIHSVYLSLMKYFYAKTATRYLYEINNFIFSR